MVGFFRMDKEQKHYGVEKRGRLEEEQKAIETLLLP